MLILGAAAIREASSLASLALYGSPVCKPKLKTNNSTPTSTSKRESLVDDSEEISKPRDRNELLYSRDEEEPNEKIDKLMEKKAKEKELKSDKEGTPKVKLKHDESKRSSKKEIKETGSPKAYDSSINTPSTSKRKEENNDNRKRKTSDEAEKKNGKKRTKTEKRIKPFAQLLEGVTLVISGIQNPDRSNLRAQALAMGAKYKSDWDNTCTHLMYVQTFLETTICNSFLF